MAEHARCPDCGTELGSDAATAGLCPRCLMSLALLGSVLDPDLDSDEGVDREAPTLARRTTGQILGERYQMRELLGRGGMGEVWRAFDLKLRVDVALKSVRPERLGSEKAHELLRQEVRSAREVVSPNVCRIFDLVVEDGRELVSMEYIDGTTLSETLRSRGPLELQEAREMASQFLSGLEAIHQAGLVHRDFKPENVMLTRAGRVVVMDFGLAKGLGEARTGTIAGTPAYMSPEQSRGETVDARTDVFAAGVVLAEMLAVGGSGGIDSRKALWKAVRETPPQVPEGPWASVLKQALDPHPEARHDSARALSHALEEVTLRLPGFEERQPYPGLASFTEEDAEYFFGREAEVEGVWKKLKRPRLLALIGPSGTGKSSFVRAGLLATMPPGWTAVVAAPGHRPFQSLAQALAPSLSGDAEAVQSLLRFEEGDIAVELVARWRQRHDHALIIVDQFEELFTLNPPDSQAAFARLLERLVLEADVHVLLSLRDDFLFQCTSQEALGPAFADLTPLRSLSESSLRRALTQPALACGYRFDDEVLVEEMIGEVSQERGALPLLAFAAARLWEKRDQEHGLLTREAYREVGGVAGALAQHAEATLERIGTQRTPLVREIFRNLVTAQGTRAARDRAELLSVFAGDQSMSATEVLDALVDARLLTSFELAGEDEKGSRQEIEIVHESLLSRWPRLVRWQTQDADGAQLRDQLRQAAQAWQDRGRPEDLLWSGSAYRDLAVWRERYTGGLSATEEAFAEAAKHLAGRRRRRRRSVLAAVVAIAASVAVVTSVLWQRSEQARERAEAEARRAEASKLVTLGQAELESYPTGALAFAMKSLELSDTEPARLLALRALQRAPMARIARLPGKFADGIGALGLDFSPDGKWVATGGYMRADLLHRDGDWRLAVGDYSSAGQGGMRVSFGPKSDVLLTNLRGDLRLWSIPEGQELRREQKDEAPSGQVLWNDGFLSLTTVFGPTSDVAEAKEVFRWWSFDLAAPRFVGSMEALGSTGISGSVLAFARGSGAYVRSLADWAAPPRLVGEHTAPVQGVALSPDGARLAASDTSGEIRLWSAHRRSPRPERAARAPGTPGLLFDPTGRRLAGTGMVDGRPTIRIFDLDAPAATQPVVLERNDVPFMNAIDFGDDGQWLATAHANDVALWWLDDQRARILAGHENPVQGVAFTPDGRWLISGAWDQTVRLWPLSAGAEVEPRVLHRGLLGAGPIPVIGPAGRHALVPGAHGRVHLIPLDGSPARELTGFPTTTDIAVAAFGEGGRLAAAGPYIGPAEEKVIRVWNLETGDVQVLGPMPGAGEGFAGGVVGLAFVGSDRIVACSAEAGIASFDLESGEGTLLSSRPNLYAEFAHGGAFGVGYYGPEGLTADGAKNAELYRFDLAGGPFTPLPDYPGRGVVAFSPTDDLLAVGSGGDDGTIRVGAVAGGEPHLLLGHRGGVGTLAFSPDGRWLASAGADNVIRLWPVPDVSKAQLHKRPLEELLKLLRTHTNLLAVPDPESDTGYALEPGLFPGWATPPEW